MSHFMVAPDPTAELCGMVQFSVFPDGEVISSDSATLHTMPFDREAAEGIEREFSALPEMIQTLTLGLILAESTDDAELAEQSIVLGSLVSRSLIDQGETMALACIVATVMLRQDMDNGGLID